MPKYVGVADFMLLEHQGALKRAALMFDGVCLAGTTVMRFLEQYIPPGKATPLPKMMATNDWLLERGVIAPAPPEFGSEALAETLLASILTRDTASRLRQQVLRDLRGPDGPRIFAAARSGIVRRAARRLEDDTGWETVTFNDQADDAPLFRPGEDSVAQIALKALPVPDDATPWEDILEYRNDPESRTRFLRLKHWINGTLAQNRSSRELYDEIQTSLAEYETT